MVRLLPLLLLLVGCDDPECTDMTRSPGGLLLTEAEHPTGWAHAECTACHAVSALHGRGCTPGVDLVEVRALVDEDPSDDGCVACHGDNGGVP